MRNGTEAQCQRRSPRSAHGPEPLGTLTDKGLETEGFDTLLVQVREGVLAHAEHEERAEFPILRPEAGRDRLMSSDRATADDHGPGS